MLASNLEAEVNQALAHCNSDAPKALWPRCRLESGSLPQARPLLGHPDCFDVAELGATFLVGWVGADDGDSITASTGTPNTTDLGSVAGGTNALASALDHLLDLKKGVAVDYADVASCGYLTNSKMESVPAKAKDWEKQYLLSSDGTELGRSQIAGRRFEISNDLPANLTKGSGTNLSAVIDGNVADLLLSLDGTLEISVER